MHGFGAVQVCKVHSTKNGSPTFRHSHDYMFHEALIHTALARGLSAYTWVHALSLRYSTEASRSVSWPGHDASCACPYYHLQSLSLPLSLKQIEVLVMAPVSKRKVRIQVNQQHIMMQHVIAQNILR